MNEYENLDTDTLIEMAMEQVRKLESLWSFAMNQISERR